MKKVRFESPLDRFPFSRIGVSYFAEQAYCEKRVELWLRNPGSLVSVPADIEKELPEANLQEELAACGTEFHESISRGAKPASEPEVEEMLRAGQSLVLAESSFQGDYHGLPLIGQPDAICFEGQNVSCVLEYKVTDSDQLQQSHRVQLLLYGYLLAQQEFNVDDLVLICVLVPRRHDKWLKKLTPAKAQKFIKRIHTEAEALIKAQPSRKNWHRLGVKAHGEVQVNLRVFKYDPLKAENELEFFTRYWRGERPAIPTTKASKCAVCLYNRLDSCPVPQVPYGEPIQSM